MITIKLCENIISNFQISTVEVVVVVNSGGCGSISSYLPLW